MRLSEQTLDVTIVGTKERRIRIARTIFLPAVLIAVAIVAFFTFRTTFALERLREQSVLDATLGFAHEKADRIDKRIIEQDNAIANFADPSELEELGTRWLPTAQRETPTVRGILILDERARVLAFASRVAGAWQEDEAFRRDLTTRLVPAMALSKEPIEELRHLHKSDRGQSVLVSYWQRVIGGRRYLIVAWHDVGRIVRELLPPALADVGTSPRALVVDEEGRLIYGKPVASGSYTVSVRFPTTLYGWRVQVSPGTSAELAKGVENRRILEVVMLLLSCVVIVLGVATILVAAERERRMSAIKSDFVANVSHELKTPLALIRMFAEILQSGRAPTEEKRKEYLDIIVGESERLTALIENVLDFARVERGRQAYDFAVGNVVDAVSKAVHVYRLRAEKEHRDLRLTIEDSLPDSYIDERAVQLAVMNLVDNALKYAHGGKSIEVRVRREDTMAVVVIIDDGPGVAPDERERVFDRFVRGSAVRTSDGRPIRGTGIGLTLVQHVAVSHGGRAWIADTASDTGANTTRGATFCFSIRLREAHHSERRPTATSVASAEEHEESPGPSGIG